MVIPVGFNQIVENETKKVDSASKHLMTYS